MTTTQQQSDLSLSITTEFRETTLHKQQLYTLVTLEAPEYESEERGSRAPIDIVCVIDVSGSMAGEKMTLMKKTLLFMIEQLKEEDKLSLVLFDTYVTNALPLVKMNEEGKKRAIETVDAIHAGSSTNLSGGLLEGLTVIKNRELPADVSSVLLFTDGLANHGITKSGPLVAAAHSVLQTITKAVSVFTFGFGKDHDANMLTEISQAGNGLYYFLETVEAIPETFGDCLGGLLSVIGQNIKVQIETLENGCEISKIHSAYKQNEIRKDHSIELVLGDIYSEEKKNIIFELSIPELRAPMDSQDLVRVTLNYFNVITNTLKSVSQFVSVARLTTVPENRETNPILDKQRNRVECANAMQRARDLGNNNQLEEARKIIKLEMERNSTSATAQDDFCRGLVNDLQDCLGDMNDRNAYQQLASKKLNNYWGSSNYERSTNSKSAAQTSYGTKAKMSRKKAATDQML